MRRWLIAGALAGMVATAALAAVLPAQAADVYRCSINGTTVFQDAPCGDSRKPVEIGGLTILGGEPDNADPLTQLGRYRAHSLNQAIENMPAVKATRARENRINRAVIGGRITKGMSEAEARLVYGVPFHVDRDGICRRLVWRNPDHAARICLNQVSKVLY
ncbi:DUF4124 domain-containing protein [Modicisalibacter coralii]|uniref:DUF4124 domain-containing protein n=1 Tax=Modicisalibacter coralii TaxID=2304602 RepID=UPI001396C6A5|nr:DUF4124 domain-containing protein [Halomonas coralii]